MILNHFDHFADPISLTFKGKRGHSTICGGLVTVISVISLFGYFCWRCTYIFDHEQDEYFMSSFFTEYEQRDPYFLKGGDLNFRVALIDSSFDNKDNPYGEFKLHRYTTIRNNSNIIGEDEIPTQDLIINLKECNKKDNDAWSSSSQKYYCPDFGDDDILYGDYYIPKNSWLRLAMHECDPTKRALLGKTCESKENIENYFQLKILNLQIESVKPDLTEYNKTPLTKYY